MQFFQREIFTIIEFVIIAIFTLVGFQVLRLHYYKLGGASSGHRKKKKWTFIRFILTVLTFLWVAAAYHLYKNGITLDQAFAEITSHFRKAPISFPSLTGRNHCLIQGINWYRITATGTDGKSFEGWVSEFAIKKSPPVAQQSEWIKKLPFPTDVERQEPSKQEKQAAQELKKALAQ